MTVTIREITGGELDQLITQRKVLVDFYSKACGPCKMLSFVLKDIVKEIDDTEIVMLDYDANKDTVEKYSVAGYPTLILFKNGHEIERMKGLQQKPAILRMLQTQ